MPENVGYITELIYKGLGHTVPGANWCEFVHGSLLSLLEECALVHSFHCV